MEGGLIVVLNQPKRRIECLNFAEVVFDFSADSFVICNSDPSIAEAVNVVNKKAYEKGRNFLQVKTIDEAKALFRPDRTIYVDPQKQELLDVSSIVSDLASEKTVMIVFGDRVPDAERIGLETSLNYISAAAIVLYELHRVRKRW